nr:MAG TPA: hypothetical protein [Caudoviricetes sp.]
MQARPVRGEAADLEAKSIYGAEKGTVWIF